MGHIQLQQQFDQSAFSIQPRPQVRVTFGLIVRRILGIDKICFVFSSLLLFDQLTNIKPFFDYLKWIP